MRVPITLDLHITAFNFPDVPPERLFEHLADMAKTAEDNGFGSVSVMDHLHQIPPMGPQELNMLEGNMALAGIAARTRKADLGLLVGGGTYRNPALLAKMCTTLDVISGGRAWFGIGAAWFEAEHDAYGVRFPPLKERFEHLEDTLRIARAMFTEERATVEGTHHRVDGAYNNPKPVRGDIPILIGGSGERKTLRMVAQYGDGCNVFGDPERFQYLMGVLDQHCEDVGRDPSEITRTTMATVVVTETQEDAERKKAAAIEGGMPRERVEAAWIGDPDTVGERAQAYRDAGVEGMTIVMPDAYDLEAVALTGKTLGAVFT
jgi:F420-dependent oxidoreductase-like protein